MNYQPINAVQGTPKTQREAVEKHLAEIGALTSFEAFTEYGITRLAAIIHNIRKDGVFISSEQMERKNRFGNSVTFSKYHYIAPSNQ